MRTAEIIPGRTYLVHVDERQSLCFQGCDLRARVVRAGFHYEVETLRGSAIRGAPFKKVTESAHANGVEIEWEEQRVWSNRRHADRENVHAGRAVVNARSVKFEIGPTPEEIEAKGR